MTETIWFLIGFITCFLILAIIGKVKKAQGPNSIIKTEENVVAKLTPKQE